ncbi:unnamed protein product, partial [Meganyctiphanes norvegica]
IWSSGCCIDILVRCATKPLYLMYLNKVNLNKVKIVSKHWVLEAFQDRRRYSSKKFSFARNKNNKQFTEVEIVAEGELSKDGELRKKLNKSNEKSKRKKEMYENWSSRQIENNAPEVVQTISAKDVSNTYDDIVKTKMPRVIESIQMLMQPIYPEQADHKLEDTVIQQKNMAKSRLQQKISLLRQKEAKETSEFNEIMAEVKDITAQLEHSYHEQPHQGPLQPQHQPLQPISPQLLRSKSLLTGSLSDVTINIQAQPLVEASNCDLQIHTSPQIKVKSFDQLTEKGIVPLDPEFSHYDGFGGTTLCSNDINVNWTCPTTVQEYSTTLCEEDVVYTDSEESHMEMT